VPHQRVLQLVPRVLVSPLSQPPVLLGNFLEVPAHESQHALGPIWGRAREIKIIEEASLCLIGQESERKKKKKMWNL
jgi:hypothetical protein